VHPPCLICLGPVTRRKSETRRSWMLRPTCSLICGRQYQCRYSKARYAQAVREHLPCLQCIGPVIPRKDEHLSSYLRRKFCDMNCAGHAQTHIMIWTNEKLSELRLALTEMPVQTYTKLGLRFGCSKNAIAGAVDRHCLRPVPRTAVVIEFPYRGCMWPHGHPDEADFHFCGANPVPGRPYCADHCAIAYMRPRTAAAS
jgi:GcrA cell cycle regulator